MRIFLSLSMLILPLLPTLSFAIQGGEEADPRSAIAQTAISLGDLSSGTLSRSFCSGVIVSDHSIVTAAHCLSGKDPAQTVVEFGFNGLETTVIRLGMHIFIPSEYKSYADALPNARNNFDIAVLDFEGGLPQGFVPAEMVTQELQKSDIGSMITIAGFGTPHHGMLNHCDVSLKDHAFSNSEFELNSSMACTPDGGDSGGPDYLVQNNKVMLYGIHNWGWHDDEGNPSMSVEAKISFYAAWIKSLP